MNQDAQTAGRALSDATQGGPQVTPARLEAFLARQPELQGATLAVALNPARRAAGASSGTTLFTLILDDGRCAPTTRELVFRYDLGGTFFRQYELVPQFWTMRALRDAGVCAPEALWLDAEGEVAGRPGLVMARIVGEAPSITPFQDGPFMHASASCRHAMLLNAARTLAAVNAADLAGGRFDHLQARGRGHHFIDREIDWTLGELHGALPPRDLRPGKAAFYREVVAVLEAVAAWLRREAPRHRPPELAHGDANITNFMYRGQQVTALLDYELTHLGIGEADLGYQLAGIEHFRLLAAPVEGIPSETELVDAYRQARGKLVDWPYAKAMGEWRLDVFAAMGMSRLPPELEHIERTYWAAAAARLASLLPEVVETALATARTDAP